MKLMTGTHCYNASKSHNLIPPQQDGNSGNVIAKRLHKQDQQSQRVDNGARQSNTQQKNRRRQNSQTYQHKEYNTQRDFQHLCL